MRETLIIMLEKAKDNKDMITAEMCSKLFCFESGNKKHKVTEKDKEDFLIVLENKVEYFIDTINVKDDNEAIKRSEKHNLNYIRVITELYRLSLGGGVEIRAALCSMAYGKYREVLWHELEKVDHELNEYFMSK